MADDKEKYTNLRNRLRYTRNNLSSAINKLDDAVRKVDEGYSIDGVSGDGNYLRDIKNELQSIYNDIVYRALPEVERQLASGSSEE